MNLSFITPDWTAPTTVRVATTTRAGGVSKPPYDSLNLGLHVGDDANAVQTNRARVADVLALPGQPTWLRQVHGNAIVQHTGQQEVGAIAEADGVWTNQSNVAIAVLTADCLPVVITNTAGTKVAVVHAGWRGLAKGIVTDATQVFAHDDQLVAWLGPAIGPQAFEVGMEVREAFLDIDAQHDKAFQPGAQDGKFLADIYQLARHELGKRHVQVFGGDLCTVSDDRFHSHRRDGVKSGRLATYAWLANPA